MLYPGRILGFGRQDDDDPLPFLSPRVEFDGVEVSSETQGQSSRIRLYPPPEDEPQRVNFSDETIHVSPAKGILRQPTQKFPEDPNPIREGVAPLRVPN